VKIRSCRVPIGSCTRAIALQPMLIQAERKRLLLPLIFILGLGIYLPDLPRSAQIVANTIATVEMFAGFSEALGFAATVTGGATVSTMWMMGTSFAWVPAMLHLGTQALRFAAILCKVIALATFAQCALLLYIDAVDSGMF
jgi:hypothetical protein